jgi:probable rRNA maturation factor
MHTKVVRLKAAHGRIKLIAGSEFWEVLVSQERSRYPIVEETIKALSEELLMAAVRFGFVKQSVRSLSELFCSDARIQELNRIYRNKDKPTDVLSFAMTEAGFSSSLGDLVVSTETTIKQAKEYGVSREAEVVRLVAHGILHLLGYDHEMVSPVEANRMRRAEKRLRVVGGQLLRAGRLRVFLR